MKKVVLFVVAIVAIAFASCGNKGGNKGNTDTVNQEITVDPTVNTVDTAAVVNQ